MKKNFIYALLMAFSMQAQAQEVTFFTPRTVRVVKQAPDTSKDNSTQEVDFVIQRDVEVAAIEVKAEENLQSKSLKAFHAENPGIRCVRTSMADYRKEEWMENVPLYAIKSYVCELGKE